MDMYEGIIKVFHYNKDGELLYKNNAEFFNIGTENLLKGYFQNVNAPDYFLIDLSNDVTLDETSSTFTAVAGSGYDSEVVNRNAVDMSVNFVTDGGNSFWRVLTKVVSFNADSTWSWARKVVLRGVAGVTPFLIGYGDLVTPREMKAGDRLDISIYLKPKLTS